MLVVIKAITKAIPTLKKIKVALTYMRVLFRILGKNLLVKIFT
jgi:hypothetical protein